MSVAVRLLLAFVAVTILLVAPTGYATLRLTELQRLAVGDRADHATASFAIGRLEASLIRFDLYLRSYLATPSPEVESEVESTLADLHGEVSRLDAAGYLEAVVAVDPMVEAIEASVRQLEALVAEGRLAEATVAFRGIRVLIEVAEERLTEAAELVDVRAQEDFLRADRISSSARTGTLFVLALSLLVAGIVGVRAVRIFSDPLRRLSSATAEVADGQFRSPEDLPYERDDEIGDLSRSFRAMTQRLAELDRMKAEFIGVASHELKTPINVVMGYAELIDDELAGAVTRQQHEILHAIAEQCQAMARLVSRLMDISRLETGMYRLELEEVYVEDLLTGLCRAHELVAARAGVDLKTHIDGSAPTTLVADVDILRDEILGNLVSNALKFTPKGGRVLVSVEGSGLLDASSSGPGRASTDRLQGPADPVPGASSRLAGDEAVKVIFRVSDTGPGIPEEHRDHVFDKYYQVERSRRVGSGLGLAIVQEMTEAHGGTVRLMNAAGSGAMFEVTLPLRPTGPPRPDPELPGRELAAAE